MTSNAITINDFKELVNELNTQKQKEVKGGIVEQDILVG